MHSRLLLLSLSEVTTEVLLIVHSVALQTPSTQPDLQHHRTLCNISAGGGGVGFLSVVNKSVPSCGTELRHAVSLSLPPKSHCSVAGEAALSASTLCYVTGGNTHTHAASLSLSPPLSLTDRDALRVHTGALPLHIPYIWMCALKLILFPAALFSRLSPRLETLKALCISLYLTPGDKPRGTVAANTLAVKPLHNMISYHMNSLSGPERAAL